MASITGKSLILYVVALEHSLGALLAQNNEEGKENALYYLSRTLVGAEHHYSPMEKVCLALIFTVQKLRHYLLTHSITLISKANPIRYLLTKPILSERLARWYMILSEFEVKYLKLRAKCLRTFLRLILCLIMGNCQKIFLTRKYLIVKHPHGNFILTGLQEN